MGNSNNDPNKGSLSLDSSAPLWSAITESISKDMPIASFKAPSGLKTATVDAFTGLEPGPFTRKTVKELFLPAPSRPIARPSASRCKWMLPLVCFGATVASAPG